MMNEITTQLRLSDNKIITIDELLAPYDAKPVNEPCTHNEIQVAMFNIEEARKIGQYNADVIYEVGVCCFRCGKTDMAIAMTEQVLRLQEQHLLAAIFLAFINSVKRQWGDAYKYSRIAHKLSPDDANLKLLYDITAYRTRCDNLLKPCNSLLSSIRS